MSLCRSLNFCCDGLTVCQFLCSFLYISRLIHYSISVKPSSRHSFDSDIATSKPTLSRFRDYVVSLRTLYILCIYPVILIRAEKFCIGISGTLGTFLSCRAKCFSGIETRGKWEKSTFIGMKCPQSSERSVNNLRNKNAIIFGKMHKIFANIIFFSYLCSVF